MLDSEQKCAQVHSEICELGQLSHHCNPCGFSSMWTEYNKCNGFQNIYISSTRKLTTSVEPVYDIKASNNFFVC